MALSYILTNPGTHPELGHLAAALTGAHRDVRYLTASMVPSDSFAGRLALRASPTAVSTLAARILPSELTHREVRAAALPAEVAFQTLLRTIPTRAPSALKARDRWFTASACRTVRKQNHIDFIVCQHLTALPIFRAARNNTVMKVLNTPIAHHRWSSAYYTKDAIDQPAWAPFLQGNDIPERVQQQLDEEIDLADVVVVASSFVRDTFIESGVAPSKVVIQPLGASIPAQPAEISDFRPGERAFRLLFAGQVNQRKGIGYLAQALAGLGGSTDIEVSAVGPISRAMTEKLLSLYPKLKIVGPVDRRRLFEFYEWADALILPSLIEGFGLTAIDAMAHARAVIVSTNTFATDVITPGVDGIVIPPRDVTAIENALEKCLDGRIAVDEMGWRAAERVSQLTWGAFGRGLMAKLESSRAAS